MDSEKSLKIVCVPFAGAGPSFYHGWAKLGFDGPTLLPVQLPGRERRIAEPPFTELHRAADALVKDVEAQAGSSPLLLFGHCFLGSVLAYELTRRLLKRDPSSVKGLIISASRPPSEARPLGTDKMSDDEFLALVKSTTGYQHEAFEIPEIRELLLPSLRADFLMDETYQFRGADKLPVPITAIAAEEDDCVTQDQVARWAEYTNAEFDLVNVPGGHMYLAKDTVPLFGILRAQAARVLEMVS